MKFFLFSVHSMIMKKTKLRTAKTTFFRTKRRQKHGLTAYPACPLLSFQGLVGGTEDLLADDQEGEGTAAAGVDLLL